MNNVKLFTSGEIHFFDGKITPIKYALVSNEAVLAHTSDDAYKLNLKAIIEPGTERMIDPKYSIWRNIYYPSYKWDKELNMWVCSNIEYIICSNEQT